jgi:hypothetical protein
MGSLALSAPRSSRGRPEQARTSSRRTCISGRDGDLRRLWRFTARRCRRRWWRRSCLVTLAAPSPARSPRARGWSGPRSTGPCFSMRSTRCPADRRPSCCGSWRPASSVRWARTKASAPAPGWWRPPTRICTRGCARAPFAKICFTGSRWSRSRCRRCASAPRISPRWCGTFSRSWAAAASGYPQTRRPRWSGHPWPGNVRELRHRIEAAALLGEGEVIELDELGLELEAQHPVIARATSLEGISALLSGTAAGGGGPSALAAGVGEACGLESELWRLVADAGMSLAQATAMCEDMLVKAALRAEGDNRTRAAARAGHQRAHHLQEAGPVARGAAAGGRRVRRARRAASGRVGRVGPRHAFRPGPRAACVTRERWP